MSIPFELSIEIGAVQQALKRDGLAGWLCYDFHGINPVARELFLTAESHVTRRWFYFIPDSGEPVLLAHKIEEKNFPPLPGHMRLYAGWQELHQRLRELLPTGRPVAMEYSPMNDVPTASYVDAGMLELVRSLDVEVVTSANLIQEFQARWSAEQLQSHISAARVLYEAQKQAFKMIEERLRANRPIDEFEVQQLIQGKIADANCMADASPIVAVNANASNPHYSPSTDIKSPIRPGDVILIDLWAKNKRPRAVYADITWMGYAGSEIPQRVQEVFDTVIRARDLAVEFLQKNAGKTEYLKGYRVDEVVRQFIREAGYGEYFIHRTGHSLGTETHANGVNIDSYETRDSRDITPGLAFSIEPGIYLPEFGIRSEINVYMGAGGPEIHTRPQTALVRMNLKQG